MNMMKHLAVSSVLLLTTMCSGNPSCSAVAGQQSSSSGSSAAAGSHHAIRPGRPTAARSRSTAAAAPDFQTTAAYNASIFDKVDKLVRKHFYNASVAQKDWPEAVKKYRPQIIASKNLEELQNNINLAISTLHASHCEFVTRNDETFYFLKSLFNSFSRCGAKKAPLMDYTGAIVGGVNVQPHQVRYVLDGSPAAKAGLLPGDNILEVNGRKFRGQADFWGTAGHAVAVNVQRNGKPLHLVLHPVLSDDYKEYVKAIEKSVRLINTPEGTIGYVHDWAGGKDAHDALEAVLSGKVNSTAGLIFDLRDGYGGNFFDDLDYFYRSPVAYPSFSTYTRKGKEKKVPLTYDKPVVTLINGGSRSGKELLAYSLKASGRSKLVGENTAGAVLGGRLFDLDNRCGLYLAVEGFDPDDVVLEGKGVAPDLVVPGTDEAGKQQQLEAAQKLLEEELRDRSAKGSSAENPK